MNFLILEPFNFTYIILFLIFSLCFICLAEFAKKKGPEFASRMLTGMMLFTLFFYFIYKILLLRDASYSDLLFENGQNGSSIWKELPLQLCNINLIVMPYALCRKNKLLLSFSFYVAPVTALMAVLFPGLGFSGYSILLPRMIGYYFTHYMIIFGSLSISFFNIQKPDIKDIPKVIKLFFMMSLFILVVNYLLRALKLAPDANYFFEMSPEGIGILEKMYSIIPHRYFYILPVLPLLALYCFGVAGVYRVICNIKELINRDDNNDEKSQCNIERM